MANQHADRGKVTQVRRGPSSSLGLFVVASALIAGAALGLRMAEQDERRPPSPPTIGDAAPRSGAGRLPGLADSPARPAEPSAFRDRPLGSPMEEPASD